MKTITTYQLEAGDVLYYVHKPDDQYVVDEFWRKIVVEATHNS